VWKSALQQNTTDVRLENTSQAARMRRAGCSSEQDGTDGYGKESLCTVDQEMPLLEGDPGEGSQSKQSRKRSRNDYSNIASNTVWIEMPC